MEHGRWATRYQLVGMEGKGCILLLALLCTIGTPGKAKPWEDTTKVASTSTITPRLHSVGYFPYTGSIVNRHLTADVNLYFEKRGAGFFLFKSFDPMDKRSFLNYFQPGVFVTLRPNSPLRVRAFVGYVFSQTAHFRDKDSDFCTALSFYWDVVPGVTLQHTVLYYDMETGGKLANRLLVTWQSKLLKVDFYLWHRWVVEEQSKAVSASVAITYSVNVSKRCAIQFTGSYMSYLTREMPAYALRQGFFVTMAVPLDLGR